MRVKTKPFLQNDEDFVSEWLPCLAEVGIKNCNDLDFCGYNLLVFCPHSNPKMLQAQPTLDRF